MHVEIPEERQHQTSEHGLKQELLVNPFLELLEPEEEEEKDEGGESAEEAEERI